MVHQVPHAPETTLLAVTSVPRQGPGRGLLGAINGFRTAYNQVVDADTALTEKTQPKKTAVPHVTHSEPGVEGQSSTPTEKKYEIADFGVAFAKSGKAYKAWKEGKLMDEDFKDLVDQWMDALNLEKSRLGWALVPAKLSMDAAGWLLKKVVKLPGRVHDMEGLTLQNIGEMLLSEDRKRDKKFPDQLHLDEIESLCHTLKGVQLKHAFRRYVKNDATKIQIALKSDSGKEEMRKEIQELLFLDPPVTRAEIEDQVDEFLKLLGGAMPPKVRKELQGNLDLIREIYENMKNLLTEDVLAELYGYVESKKEINYDTIGDQIGRLKDDAAIVKFITAFDLDTLKGKTFNLGDKNSIQVEAHADPEGLKAEIANLFDVSGKPTMDKVERRADLLRSRLKAGTSVSGLGTAEEKKRQDLIDYITNCALELKNANVLDELAGTATQLSSDEPVEALMDARTTEAVESYKKALVGKIDEVEFNFEVLTDRQALEDLPQDDLANHLGLIVKLFSLASGRNLKIEQVKTRVEWLVKRLGFKDLTAVSGTPATTTSPTLDEAKDRLAALLKNAFEAIRDSKILERYQVPYATWGHTILETRELDTKTRREDLVRSFKRADFDRAFGTLVNLTLLGYRLQSATGRAQVQAKLAEFLGQEGELPKPEFQHRIQLMRDRIGPDTDFPSYKTEHAALFQALKAVKDNLEDKLDELFKKDPEITRLQNYTEFTKVFANLDTEEKVLAFLRGFSPRDLKAAYLPFLDKTTLIKLVTTTNKDHKAELQARALSLAGKELGTLGKQELKLAMDHLLSVLKLVSDKTVHGKKIESNYDEIVDFITTIITEVDDAALDLLFQEAQAKKITVNYTDFGEQCASLPDEDIPAYLKAFNGLKFAAEFPYLTSSLNATIASTNNMPIKDEINRFLGRKTWVPITEATLQQTISNLELSFTLHAGAEMAGYLRFKSALDQVKGALSKSVLKALN